jgi:MFS family permease
MVQLPWKSHSEPVNLVNQASRTNPSIKLFWLIAFMWGAYFLNYCDRQAIFAMFKVLKSDLGMTDQQLGLTGAVFLWIYGLGCPLAGQLADRFSKRLMVVLSLAIWSLTTLATGLAGSAMVLLLLRAVMGISESLFMPAAIALTANAAPVEKRSRAVSLLTTAQIAGTVTGAWFGGWMAELGHWRWAFFILGGIGLAYSVPYFLFLKNVEENTEIQTGKTDSGLSVYALVKVPTFCVLCFAFPVFVFGLWMLYSWMPSFLADKFNLGPSEAAFNASIYMQVATLAGLFLGGILADRLFVVTKAARLWLLVVSLACCAPCLHLIGSSQSLSATRLSLTGFGLFGGFLMGNIFPSAFEVVSADKRASAVGILNFFGSMLSGFAPLVVGTWKKSIGIERMLTATSLVYLVASMVLIFTIFKLFPRDWERMHSNPGLNETKQN